ncbi:hypothetical protein N8T08_008470 [Aspergillus melleus]|uniref:Uncharacterized protein n=1 Tax=Aspergillus melleus TaxID=138277 RepID=A0ACC3AVT9_9EURO|nr:hypothetical protein N8T08_008470 [Aspergillus melleus]
MAYPQRPAQRPPPGRNYGGGGPPPRGGGFQGPPQDGYFDQEAYDFGYDNPKQRYNNGGYDDAGYGYPGDQAAVPRSYGPPRGAPRPPRGGYGPPMQPPPDRSYAYGGRSAPNGYDDRRGYGDRGPPRSDRMRPPPRQVPQSPDKMGYDNPFPMFSPKEPARGRADSQGRIERGMAGMDLNGMPPVKPPVRPHTSNGRRPDVSARPPMPMPPPTGRGRGNAPGPPMRSASAGRHVAAPLDRSYTDASEPPPPIPQINRSATMPVTSAPTPPPVSKPLYPGQTTYQEPSYAAFRYTREYSTEELLDVYYNSAHAAEPDMPNFDAIPENGNGGLIDESLPGLEQPKPKKAPIESPPPSRGQYTAFNPQAAQLHHAKSQPDMRSGNAPNQFENAGFHFDLPGEPPSSPGYSPAYSPGYRHDSMGFGIGDNPYNDPTPAPYRVSQDSRTQSITSYSERRPSFAAREGSIRSNGPPKPYRANQPGYVNNPPPPVNEIEPAMDPEQNPDALPHHPAPFRPGLNDSGSKPAPVRQYNPSVPVSGPVPTPPPAPASAPPALQGPPTEMTVPQPVTPQEIQRLQQIVKSRPSDQSTQLLLAKKLVEASTVLVEASRMDPKTKAKSREKYLNDAYKIIKKLVAAGNGEAQFFLADAYGQGLMGLQVDNKEAFNLYHSAAKQGHGQSAYRVAVCCEIGAEEGGGTKRDPFKAVQWYKRAASLGDPPAMYKMGMILLKGLLGQAKNPREGISWLKRAAERADVENPHALHELALLYVNAGTNDVVIRDESYACQLFHQAAELGYKFSQNRLGTAYEYGLMGCPVDPRQSIIWYTSAAAQGEHQSELALSGWYLTGSEGILQQSDTEAFLWARKAASAGLAKAEYAMGYFTEVGIGTTSNLDDAKRWYWRAAAQGFPKARERLEELKKGGARMQKTRLSRSAVNQQKQNDGDCVIM